MSVHDRIDTGFHIQCDQCGTEVGGFLDWHRQGQACPACGAVQVSVRYHRDYDDLACLIRGEGGRAGLWRYHPFLPVASIANIVSSGEGAVAVERWPFLERLAERHGVTCEVYAHRHDNNPSTGTFKDLAGSVIASVLKENGVTDYVVASTGNIGVAMSRYLAAAGVGLSVFIPRTSSPLHDAEMGCFGQKVFRVKGDYARAKELASRFAADQGFLLSPGGFDPIRVEAKKTMFFEWLRVLGRSPSIYIQALSGGMGPIGIAKGIDELKGRGLFDTPPRFYLVQSDRCAPMARAWAAAKAAGFPDGWLEDYPVIEDPETEIATLATGRPGLYPIVGRIVRDSGGEIVSFREDLAVDVARIVAFEVAVRIGPAAAIAVGGFFEALRRGDLRDGDRVMIAIGEGMRRAPDFMAKMAWSSEVSEASQCVPADRDDYARAIWRQFGQQSGLDRARRT